VSSPWVETASNSPAATTLRTDTTGSSEISTSHAAAVPTAAAAKRR